MKHFIKRYTPASLRKLVAGAIAKLNAGVVRLASTSDFGSSVYYLLFSKHFRREHRAVLKGKVRYTQALEISSETHFQLRRNIHRLEKGLIMKPRRETFAVDYIQETVECFRNAQISGNVCEEELTWARDVLSVYFQKVTSTSEIRAAEVTFKTVCPSAPTPTKTPYLHSSIAPSQVDFESFSALCLRRRSVRWFQNRVISADVLQQAVSVAALAPSACNRQPFSFHIKHGAEAVQLAGLAGGAAGFAHNIPCCIAVVGNLSAYPFEKDRHLIYIDGSLSSMQLMLAFETLGVSTCSINWPDLSLQNRRIKKFLGLESYHHTVMLIAVGYAEPDGGVPYSAKRSFGKISRAN